MVVGAFRNNALKGINSIPTFFFQLEQQLAKYQFQFNDVMRNMIDAQETILQTVDNLYKDTKRLIQKVEDPNSTDKLK